MASTANNWYQDQLTNKNFLSPIGFVFLLKKASKTSFLCQKATVPTISIGEVPIPTPGMVPIPIEGNMVYGDLEVEFIVDEDLRNYMEIHNWMRALGTPQNYGERKAWEDKWKTSNRDDPRFSDATLQVLNNNNLANFDILFRSLYPTALSGLPFDVTGNDNTYLTASATFKYMLFEVRNVSSLTRR